MGRKGRGGAFVEAKIRGGYHLQNLLPDGPDGFIGSRDRPLCWLVGFEAKGMCGSRDKGHVGPGDNNDMVLPETWKPVSYARG